MPLIYFLFFMQKGWNVMKKSICILIAALSFVAGVLFSVFGFLLFFIPKRESHSHGCCGCHEEAQHDLDYEVEHCDDPDAWYGGYEDSSGE